jgi:16S rRNA (adenine1518-N6/adenine1519-N6)-dimethyltransferase
MTQPYAHTPRKRFGQHFLHERGVIERLVRAIAPQAGEHFVEIGPGEGALTYPLLACGIDLTVLEIDRDLIAALQAQAERTPRLRVVAGDALNADLTALAGAATIRLVGNLPYNVSTPLLFHALEHANAIHDMHFMLQKEVVDRMAAGPGSKTYGRLSVMLQARCRVEALFRVPPGAFRPPPKVESAIVKLTPLPDTALPRATQAALDRAVRAAFAQRRKTLVNALRGVADATTLTQVGIDPGWRAEQVAVTSFLALAHALAQRAA